MPVGLLTNFIGAFGIAAGVVGVAAGLAVGYNDIVVVSFASVCIIAAFWRWA